MSSDLFTLSEDATLEEAAFHLNADMVSGAPVHNADGKIVGIISKTDIVDVEREHKTMAMTKVKDAMHTDVRTVTPDTPVSEAVQLMSDHNMHRMLVADADGTPRGMVTSMDIVHAVAKGTSFD
jgi:predicted transcriptional regulator